MTRDMANLKTFLFARVYHHDRVMSVMAGAEQIVADLFARYRDMGDANALPSEWRDIMKTLTERDQARLAADYLAGQTDRYAIAEHRRLFDNTPEWRYRRSAFLRSERALGPCNEACFHGEPLHTSPNTRLEPVQPSQVPPFKDASSRAQDFSMNIFAEIEVKVKSALEALQSEGKLPADLVIPLPQSDATRDPSHGDVAINVAMVLAKAAKMKPRDIADLIKGKLEAMQRF